MHLYIMRHGHAAMLASSDQQRQLSEQGQQEVQQMAHYLQQHAQSISQVWVSPYLRTQQTWQLMQPMLAVEQVITQPCLQPDSPVEQVIEALTDYLPQTEQNILLISHLPLVGYLTAKLQQTHQLANFTTASIAALAWQKTDQAANCLWFHSPSHR